MFDEPIALTFASKCYLTFQYDYFFHMIIFSTFFDYGFVTFTRDYCFVCFLWILTGVIILNHPCQDPQPKNLCNKLRL